MAIPSQRRHEQFPPGAVLTLQTLLKDEECESDAQIAAPSSHITGETLLDDTLRVLLPLLLTHELRETFLRVRKPRTQMGMGSRQAAEKATKNDNKNFNFIPTSSVTC